MAGFWKKLLQRSRLAGPVPMNGDGGLLSMLPTGGESDSGVNVTVDSALRGTAVLACVRVLSETIASLPLHVFERVDGKRRLATDHPAYRLLHRQPNPEITSFEFREWIMNNVLTYGNGYAVIERNPLGEPVALWPQIASRVTAFRAPGTRELWYRVHNAGESYVFPAVDVFHLRGFANGGLVGRSLVDLGTGAIGLAAAQEKYAGRIFASGGAQRMALERPGDAPELSPAGMDNLRKSWRDIYGSPERVHEVAVLEEGTSAKIIGVSPLDSQLIEGRTYQVAEVARIFRIPQHMIGELTRSTNNNIEHQSLEFGKYVAMPWTERWEQRLDMTLLVSDDYRHYFKFSLEGLLRGDTKARAEFYKSMFGIGAFSANQILAFEDMDSIGPQGDLHMLPLNMAPAEAVLAMYQQQQAMGEVVTPPPQRGAKPAPDYSAIKKRHMPLLRDAVRRIIRAEVRERRKNRDADISYFASQALLPAVSVVQDAIREAQGIDESRWLDQSRHIGDILASGFVERSSAALADTQDPDALYAEWVESRADSEAQILIDEIISEIW